MQKVTPSAIGLNRNMPSSEVKASGQRTRRVQMVETSSGSATWLAPRNDASLGSTPIARCRSVFSRQITALSTIGPSARVSPARVITLIVFPVAYRQVSEVRTDKGSVIPAIAVIFHCPRKSRITRTQKKPPVTPSWTSPLIAWRTKIDWSMTTSRLMFALETRSSKSLIDPFTVSTTRSVLAPSWRKIGI